MTSRDDSLMRRALVAARRWAGRCWPNPTVGACLVGFDGWICEGVHRGAGSAHAEVDAIRSARVEQRDLSRSTLYVTLEPCNHQGRTGPCSEAILEAKIPRVVYAVADPNASVAGGGAQRLAAAGVAVSLAPDACQLLAQELNAPYFEGDWGRRPHLTLKLAVDLDGRLARRAGRMEEPELRAITGERVQRRVHRMRDASSCVLVGRGTVLADHPRLDIRRVAANHRPRAVVLDTKLASDAHQLPQASLVLHGGASAARVASLEGAGHECVLLPAGPRDWSAVLSELSRRGLGIVLVEGGAEIAQSLLNAGLVDRLHLFVSPRRIGGDGPQLPWLAEQDWDPRRSLPSSALALGGLDWAVLRRRRIGDDWEWVLRS